ncbi:LysR family transcriptional regulator [Enterococcus hirae]|nr:LysR family transcriptional regulator [Enterococcus hirae]
MNIKQIKYVLAVADCGSFREAAKQMKVTQPSLSHGIKELEKELELPLLIRTNRGAFLTKSGQEFYRDAEKIVYQLERLQGNFSEVPQTTGLRIAHQHFYFVAQAVDRLLKGDSHCRQIELAEYQRAAVIKDVADSRSEIGIIRYSAAEKNEVAQQLERRGLTCRFLEKQPTVVYVGEGHPLGQQKNLAPQMLAAYPEARLVAPLRDPAKKGHVIEATDRGTLFGILQHTNAYTIGCRLFAERPLCSLICEPEENEIGLLTRKNLPLSPSGARFIRELYEMLKI